MMKKRMAAAILCVALVTMWTGGVANAAYTNNQQIYSSYTASAAIAGSGFMTYTVALWPTPYPVPVLVGQAIVSTDGALFHQYHWNSTSSGGIWYVHVSISSDVIVTTHAFMSLGTVNTQ